MTATLTFPCPVSHYIRHIVSPFSYFFRMFPVTFNHKLTTPVLLNIFFSLCYFSAIKRNFFALNFFISVSPFRSLDAALIVSACRKISLKAPRKKFWKWLNVIGRMKSYSSFGTYRRHQVWPFFFNYSPCDKRIKK